MNNKGVRYSGKKYKNMTLEELEKDFEENLKLGRATGTEYFIFRKYQELKLLIKCEMFILGQKYTSDEILTDINNLLIDCNMRNKDAREEINDNE